MSRTTLLAIVLGLLAPAFASAQTLAFEERGETAGIHTTSGVRSVAVHDFDQDGWDDLLLTRFRGSLVLLRNNQDGTFSDMSAAAGLAVSGPHVVSLWGDLDGDGDADLFVGQRPNGISKVFRNEGDGTFARIAVAGLDSTAQVGSASFADYDGDGRLDLFLAVEDGPDLLYRNTSTDETLAFEDVSDAAGVRVREGFLPMQAAWLDFDHDGDLDLLATHDGPDENRLYENRGTLPFAEVARSKNVARFPDGACCTMGIAYADLNTDGWQDLYLTRMFTGSLFLNNPAGTFAEAAPTLGVVKNGMSWGVVAADFDNDADQELYVANTSSFDGMRSLFYRNDGAAGFADAGADLGIDFYMEAIGLATGDFNNDGLPDLVIPDNGSGKNKLLINTTTDAGHWAKVHLTGTTQNRLGIGARVEIVAEGTTFVRTVGGGDSFCSQSSSTLHFGLGTASQIDTLRVVWAPGLVDEYVDLDGNTTHALTQQNTSTHREAAAPLPASSFALSPAFPNPFRSQTQVTLHLASATHVSLALTDVLGRTVQVLATGPHAPGTHTFSVDGAPLPAGLYFLHLQTPQGPATRAVTILP